MKDTAADIAKSKTRRASTTRKDAEVNTKVNEMKRRFYVCNTLAKTEFVVTPQTPAKAAVSSHHR